MTGKARMATCFGGLRRMVFEDFKMFLACNTGEKERSHAAATVAHE